MRRFGTIASTAVLPLNPPAFQVRSEVRSYGLQAVLEKIDVPADDVLVVPEIRTKQKDDSSAGANDFEFRPLTEAEKKEFVNSLDAKGKQLLAELEGKARSSGGSAEDVAVPFCCL
jgi:hypothetical protein